MRVLIYCQYLLGVGHLFRALRVAGGLQGHDVVLLAGGPEVFLDLPEHVRLVRQPALFSNESFNCLLAAPGEDVALVKQQRTRQLMQLMNEFRPDVLMTEQYPFGRSMFRFELEPCLRAIQSGVFGDVKVVCSMRDVISMRDDQKRWEEKVLRRLEPYNALIVHGDPLFLPLELTFSRANEVPCSFFYSGYVAPFSRVTTPAKKMTVVAGLGGGRVARELALALINAFQYPVLAETCLHLFPGPLADEAWLKQLNAYASGTKSVRLMPYAPDFYRQVAGAELAVGLGGYNTSVEILAAGVPALLHAWDGSPEQALRCRAFSQAGFVELLETLPSPKELAQRIKKMLDQKRPSTRGLNLNGANNTARLLEAIVQGDHK